MIEKETLNKLYEKTKRWVDSIKTEDNWCEKDEEFMEEEWILGKSLLPKLEEAFNKSQPISTKIALGRIIKEIKEQ
jgi:hypothetical protein